MNYTIRKATNDDLESILEIGNKSLDEYERIHLGDDMVNEYIKSGRNNTDIIEKLDCTTVMLLEDTIIGFSIWVQNIVHGFVIDSVYWGTGAAQHFMTQMLEEKLKIYKEVSLECFESSPRANSFYQKMGWINVGTTRDDNINRIIYKKLRY